MMEDIKKEHEELLKKKDIVEKDKDKILQSIQVCKYIVLASTNNKTCALAKVRGALPVLCHIGIGQEEGGGIREDTC